MLPTGTWQGLMLEFGLASVITDGTYIYAGCGAEPTGNGNPTSLIKIDPATMNRVAEWLGGSSDFDITALAFDGTFLYGALTRYAGATHRVHLVKIDPATMTEVGRYIDTTAGDNSTFGVTVLAGNAYLTISSTNPGQVIKINTTTMAEVSRWVGLPGRNQAESITNDGTFLYATYLNAALTASLVKINPATMLEVANFQSGLGANSFGTFYDGTFVYFATDTTPGTVFQVNPATMLPVKTFTGAVGEDIAQALTGDGVSIYVGLAGAAGHTVQVNPATMLAVATYNPGVNGSRALVTLAGNLYDGISPNGASPGVATVAKVATATMLESLRFNGRTFKEECATGFCLLEAGGFLYVGTGAFSGDHDFVVKVDPATMLTVARWSGAPGEQAVLGLAYDGTFLYASLGTSPAIVIKINPATMTTVAEWTGGAGDNSGDEIDYDGTFLYVALSVNPGVLVKINPSTMLEVSRWTGAAGQQFATAVLCHGGVVYVSLNSNPGQVVKLNPATMLPVSTWVGAAGENGAQSLTFMGTNLYVAIYQPGTGLVVKIDPATMLTVSEWVGDGIDEYNAASVTHDGLSIYCGLDTFPSVVAKIDPATMLETDRYIAPAVTDGVAIEQDEVFSATFSGSSAYFLNNTNPGIALKFAAAPVITTSVQSDAASGVFRNKATLNGTLTDDGGEACVVQFEYGLNMAYGTTTAGQAGFHTGNTFAQLITGLTPGTTYHYRALATNSGGTVVGGDQQFITPLLDLPTVNTNAASLVQRNKATLNGTLTDDGGEACTVKFEYGLTMAYGTTTGAQAGFVTGNTFAQLITGLVATTSYHFRAIATNSMGTVVGPDQVFTTTATNPPVHGADAFFLTQAVSAPTVQTLPLRNLGNAEATFFGLLTDDGGLPCITAFEYGTSPAIPLQFTTPTQPTAIGAQYSVIQGALTPNTQYYYRAKAINSAGTVFGAVLGFVTKPAGNRAHALSREEL